VKLPYTLLLPLAVCICLTSISTTIAAENTELPEPAALSGGGGGDIARTLTCLCFNDLNTLIRDSRIGRDSAQEELQHLLSEVRDEYHRAGGRDYRKDEWVFPLSGYDSRAIGGGRRHGYISGGYDFFKGNRHGGHPSFDIFIRDRNQDGLDDRNKSQVKVLSLTGGIVVALEHDWQTGSRLLGGRYIWIYDPANDLLVYYAHNSSLAVELGQIVKPGDLLAMVGRSGFNAAKRRSPTHLHLTVLKVSHGGRVVPVDVYRELRGARLPGGES
jgi:murein DD-endopeptidase MepM/ murein hydrolase activator NlpD